jgi:hypothetical protein
MKRIARILILFLSIFLVTLSVNISRSRAVTIDEFSERITSNVVRIKAQFADNTELRGFGFIIVEQNEMLYIVTAAHVVMNPQSGKAIDIGISLFGIEGLKLAELVNNHERYDIALLKISKPSGYKWVSGKLSSKVTRDSKVWFIGRGWSWDNITEDLAGTVSKVTGFDISVDMSAITPGASGGPLFTANNIVGMIIEDSGHKVVAVKIDFIQDLVFKEWLKIEKAKDVNIFPYVSLGTDFGLPIPIETSSTQDSVISFPSVFYGYYLDVAISPKFTVRLSHGDGKLDLERTFNLTGEGVEFRNEFDTTTIRLQIYDESPLFNRYFSQSTYYFLGYAIGNILPELRLNKGPWTELEEAPGFQDSYSKKYDSFIVGVGGETTHSNTFLVGFELGLAYTTSKYFYIDVNKPLEKNDKDDWFIFIKINVGYTFKKKLPSLKILR